MDFKKFTKVIGIEILILIVINIIKYYFATESRMGAGSWSLLGPLPFFEEIYQNSALMRSGFNLTNSLIDLVIIIGIAIIFSIEIKEKWQRKKK